MPQRDSRRRMLLVDQKHRGTIPAPYAVAITLGELQDFRRHFRSVWGVVYRGAGREANARGRPASGMGYPLVAFLCGGWGGWQAAEWGRPYGVAETVRSNGDADEGGRRGIQVLPDRASLHSMPSSLPSPRDPTLWGVSRLTVGCVTDRGSRG